MPMPNSFAQAKSHAAMPLEFCVPTGNFGDVLAGYFAKRMGLPVGKLIVASNCNNVLSDFLTEGVYDRNREFFKTISPSMDILISSNLSAFCTTRERWRCWVCCWPYGRPCENGSLSGA